MENEFKPSDLITQLIKMNLMDRQRDNESKEEFAERAQEAAEDFGIDLENAERVYDYILNTY